MELLVLSWQNHGMGEIGIKNHDLIDWVGVHFVSSPRERVKIDRRDSRRDEREGQGRKRNRNESEETEERKTSLPTLTCYKDSRPCPTISQYQLDAPGDKRYMTPSHHPTTHKKKSWISHSNHSISHFYRAIVNVMNFRDRLSWRFLSRFWCSYK